jgi:hypothetical protein
MTWRAIPFRPLAEAEKAATEAEASTSGEPAEAAAAEEGLSLKSQILVLWGNVLFERQGGY